MNLSVLASIKTSKEMPGKKYDKQYLIMTQSSIVIILYYPIGI